MPEYFSSASNGEVGYPGLGGNAVRPAGACDPTVANTAATNQQDVDFLAMFDDIWARLLLLAKQLRDVMRLYNEKKQSLGWELEVNTLTKSFAAIDNSALASRQNAWGNMIGGGLMICGAGAGVKFGEACSMAGNAFGQMTNGLAGFTAASSSRQAEVDRSIADLQNKGSQAYTRNLDDIVQKARDIMQQMMELGRSMVDVYSQTLRAVVLTR